ncbi:MAG: DUF1573 domain-containing protein [Bacillota bacterium]|nr:DUF1573 domain-containing protein [Bacillota bacterium]
MKDLLCDEFQNMVEEYLIRHQSIVDILSKSQECNARVNRAIAKAATSCGCIRIKTGKQSYSDDTSLSDLKDLINNHIDGCLCESCREIIETEMGKALFYLTAICSTLNLSLYDVLLKEHKKVSTLRIFNLT